jgi:L-threonylcarbamoyladenylate synthase
MAPVLQVDPDAPAADVLARAADALRRGALIVYPTETLYAVGGRALDPDAARRTREAKGRPDGKPLPLVAADLDQARALCADWPEAAARLAARFWPGPLTLLLGARNDVPAEVTAGEGSVAVRVSGRLLVRLLCQAAGPSCRPPPPAGGRPRHAARTRWPRSVRRSSWPWTAAPATVRPRRSWT